MNIRITAGGARVTHRLKQHVEHRVGLALGRYATRIRAVTVAFAAQGPRQQLCRLTVSLRNDVNVEAAGADMFSAVDLATDHATRRIARVVETEMEAATRDAYTRRKRL